MAKQREMPKKRAMAGGAETGGPADTAQTHGMTPAVTVGEALAWASSALSAFGSRAPRAEADVLLEWATGWTRTRILLSIPDVLPTGAADRLREAVAERTRGVPLQYITGQAGFYGRLFAVRPGCLIPRPETEVLAEAAIEWIRTHAPAARVVDLGCGSGALAVTLAAECRGAQVTAIDVSPEAVDITRHNADELGAAVNVIGADGFAWLGANADAPADAPDDAPDDADPNAGLASPRMQVLVSNPPYIPSSVIEHLDAEVRDFEPRLALDGGADGLDPYRHLSRLGASIFDPGPAALFLEVGDDQADDVLRLFAAVQEPETAHEGHLAAEHAPERPSLRWAGSTDWPGWRFWDIADLRGVRRVVAGERL